MTQPTILMTEADYLAFKQRQKFFRNPLTNPQTHEDLEVIRWHGFSSGAGACQTRIFNDAEGRN